MPDESKKALADLPPMQALPNSTSNLYSPFIPPPPILPPAMRHYLHPTFKVGLKESSSRVFSFQSLTNSSSGMTLPENSGPLITNEQCYKPVISVQNQNLVHDYSCYQAQSSCLRSSENNASSVASYYYSSPTVSANDIDKKQTMSNNASFVAYPIMNPGYSFEGQGNNSNYHSNCYYYNQPSVSYSSYFPNTNMFVPPMTSSTISDNTSNSPAVELTNDNNSSYVGMSTKTVYEASPVLYSRISPSAKPDSNKDCKPLLGSSVSKSPDEESTTLCHAEKIKKPITAKSNSAFPKKISVLNEMSNIYDGKQEISKNSELKSCQNKVKPKDKPLSENRKISNSSEKKSDTSKTLQETPKAHNLLTRQSLSPALKKRKFLGFEEELAAISSTDLGYKRKSAEKSFSIKASENDYSLKRKSLPNISLAEDIKESHSTPKTENISDLNRRKSFPCSSFSPVSPLPAYKRCTTDQTPYDDDIYNRRKRLRTILPRYNALDLVGLESETGFIDSHCHLDFLFHRQGFMGTLKSYQEKNEDTFPKSFKGCIAVFCNPFTFRKDYVWKKYLDDDNVWASFGCHPHNAKDYNDIIERDLCSALKHSKVKALGEIGLDYSNRNNCMKDVQFEVFKRQLNIALKEKLPLVIHCREAHEDGMRIMKEILPLDYTIHLHCFTDKWEFADEWLKTFPNLCIGITNVVTYPSAESVHEVARNIPLDRLLLETDAPYFLPKMGVKDNKWSHPGMAIHVAAQIAALKNVSIEDVFCATLKNTKRVYNL